MDIDVGDFNNLIRENSSCPRVIDATQLPTSTTLSKANISSELIKLNDPTIDIDSSPLILIDQSGDNYNIYIYNNIECINRFKELLSSKEINKSDGNTKTIYYRFSDQLTLFNNQ